MRAALSPLAVWKSRALPSLYSSRSMKTWPRRWRAAAKNTEDSLVSLIAAKNVLLDGSPFARTNV